jgi:histidyl-tRNA synthetase
MGIERVIVNLKRQEVPLPDRRRSKVVVAHVGDASRRAAISLSSELRRAGIASLVGPSTRGLRSQLRYASSVDATHALILGDDELQRGTIVLRDLGEGEQEEIELKVELLVERLTGGP